MSGAVLVTGATGTVGCELVRLLAEAGAEVRAGVHDPRHAGALPRGARPVAIDFLDPGGLEEACRGVDALYLLTPQVPEATEYVRRALEAATRAGVGRVVRHSMHDAPHGRDPLSRWHREAEAQVASSGLAFTVLRPNAFMQNFVTIYAPAIRAHGLFRLPLGAAAVSSVDARDVAAAAAAVLLHNGHDGRAYVLTGPEALTGEAMAATLTAVLGRPIRYLDEPEDAARPPRRRRDIVVSEALVELGAEMRAGKLAEVSPGVERLTGSPAGSFDRFVRDHRRVWLAGPAP